MGTNKAEEILHKHYSLASGMEYEHKTIIDAMEEYRQSGIDELTKKYDAIEMANRIIIQDLHEKNTELTKEVEILEEWKKKYEDNQVEIFERVKNQEHKIVDLTKEVERLREEREHSINKLNNLINDCQERADNFLELGMDASEKTSLAMKHAYLEAKNIIKFHPPINQ